MKQNELQNQKRNKPAALKLTVLSIMVLFLTTAGIAAQNTRESDLQSLMYDKNPGSYTIVIGDEHYTLINTLNMASPDSIETNHIFVKGGTTSKKELTAPYVGTTAVTDMVLYWTGGVLHFIIKDNLPHRDILIVRRTDATDSTCTVKVAIDGVDAGVLAPCKKAYGTSCWRNRTVELSADKITKWDPEITFTADAPADNSGTIWIYQQL